jgi:hypothetical protein
MIQKSRFGARELSASGTRETAKSAKIEQPIGLDGQISSIVERLAALRTASRRPPERSREAEFVAVGIGHVKVALAPFGIARRGRGLVAGSQRTLIRRIDVVDMEDDASPR